MRDSFVHLNVHSEYSIADGTIRIPQLIERCKKHNFSTVAITDLNNLFAAIKFNREAKKAGIKPIIGAEVTIIAADKDTSNYSSIFLCRNEGGYKNLCDILTICQKGESGQIGIPESVLFSRKCDGIIILSGDQDSDIGQAILKRNFAQAKARVHQWENLTNRPRLKSLEVAIKND